MTTEITIFEPQNVAAVAQAAPQAYNENRLSHDRCLQAGQELLDREASEGMSDSLDQEIATYIERSKKTLRKMNGKRSAVTQLFDTIRSAYTSLENEVDPTKRGTVPQRLQECRNRYAAKKREEQEAEMRRRQMEQARTAARNKYAADVEEDIKRQFNMLVTGTCNRLVELDRSLTLDNYDDTAKAVRETDTRMPEQWKAGLHASVLLPSALAPQEARDIRQEVKQRLQPQFEEQYLNEVSACRDDILDRMPSKRAELERIAKASLEEAERIKRQMLEREQQEAEQRERERQEREAKEKAAAELAAQKQQISDLFGSAEAQVAAYQPKTQVRKKIHVLNPEGFMQVIGMWWAQYGCTLTMEELEKTFSKQVTFCNKLANDKTQPLLIQSEHIEYIDDVKAK